MAGCYKDDLPGDLSHGLVELLNLSTENYNELAALVSGENGDVDINRLLDKIFGGYLLMAAPFDIDAERFSRQAILTSL